MRSKRDLNDKKYVAGFIAFCLALSAAVMVVGIVVVLGAAELIKWSLS